MRKIFVILLIISSLDAFSCDVCGCANSGSFFGILPQSQVRFIGLKYRNQYYESHLSSQYYRATEHYQSAELWGRFFPLKRTQLLVSLPYNFNQQTILKTNAVTNLSGMGDATILGHYNLKNTFWDSTAHRINQSFLIGGGIKLPTGKFKYSNEATETANPNFQLGTGSVDFLINTIYTARYENWGLNADVTYKINTQNANRYQFGNRINSSLSVFYSPKIGQFTWMPYTGIFGEYAWKDTDHNQLKTYTGGYRIMANMGIDVYVKRISVGVVWQKPLRQELAHGEILIKSQLATNVSFMF